MNNQTDMSQYFLNGLVERGFPEHIAAGFVENGRDESGLDPTINEKAPIVKGSRGGFGLMQWTGPRRRQLEAFAQKRGTYAGDPDLQMDFLKWETENTEKGSYRKIAATSTPEEAAVAIVRSFLRPAPEHQRSRSAKYAKGLFGNATGPLLEEVRNRPQIDGDTAYNGANLSDLGESPMARYVSPQDTFEAEQQKAEEGTIGFREAAGIAIDDTWVSGAVLKQMGKGDWEPDADFQYTKELYAELSEGLPETYADQLEDATSEAHARSISENMRKEYENAQKMHDLGWTGVAMHLGASALDPVAIGASIVTEGAAAPLIYGAKVGRAARFVRAGAVVGGTNAALETYIASQSPVGDWRDVAFAGGVGFLLGGAYGAFSRGTKGSDFDTTVEKLTQELAVDDAARVIDDVAGEAVVDGSVGAARVTPLETETKPWEYIAEQSKDTSKTAKPFGMPRIDAVGVLKLSENSVVRRLAGLLAEDAVGNADGTALARSASESVAREMRVRQARFYREYHKNFKEWRKENGISIWRSDVATQAQFNRTVGQAVRRDLDAPMSKSVAATAAMIKKEHADLLKFAKEKNIPGFDNVPANYNYMTRRHNIPGLASLIERHGEGKITQLVAKSIRDANMGHVNKGRANRLIKEGSDDYDMSINMANAYIKSVLSRRYGQFDLNRALAGEDMDTLTEILKDSGMEADKVGGIVDSLRAAKGDRSEDGKIGSAKFRLDLDETTTMKFLRADGEWDEVGIEDFLENDAELLFTGYARSVLGAGYLEDALSQFKVPDSEGVLPKHAPSISTVKGYIASEAGRLGMKESDVKSELRILDNLYKRVRGNPVEGSSKFTEAQRFLRDFNFSRVGGQLGVAQLAELGNIIGNGGFRVLMQNVPSLKSLIYSAKKGQFSDELFNEIEAIWGFGTDWVRSSPMVRMDEGAGEIIEGKDFGGLGRREKFDYRLQQAKNATAAMSGMAPVNTALQRMNARVIITRFMEDAANGRPINTKRLRTMGLDENMHKRVQDQLNKHVNSSKGMMGRKVNKLNLDKWDDNVAREAFVNGVDRWAKKSIQENDIGNLPDFMSYELSKTVFQFRTFMLAAYTKQLASGLHHRDWETLATFMTSMFFGGLFYVGQQTVNAVGRGDGEEWLEERLSPGAIAAASFQRAGFSSLLPIGMDIVAGAAGIDPIFDYRSSGLSNAGGIATSFTSNPTVDLGDKIIKGAQGVTSALFNPDYDYSQQDWRNLTGISIWQNAFGIRNGLSLIGSALPTYSQ